MYEGLAIQVVKCKMPTLLCSGISNPTPIVQVILQVLTQKVYTYNIPSGSPGSRLTRRCSQSSRSFACNLCLLSAQSPTTQLSSAHATHCLSHVFSSTNSPYPPRRKRYTHIILVPHVDLPSILPQAHGLVMANLLVLAVISLVAKRGCGRQHK